MTKVETDRRKHITFSQDTITILNRTATIAPTENIAPKGSA